MALLTIDHFSEALNLSHTCTVILPQETRGQIGMTGTVAASGGGYPTLWLLHGRTDDHSIWLRRTSIERYVAPLGLAVVMPAVHLSRYTNMVHGGRYWDYISEELPALIESWLPIATTRERRFVAGLSMGGWGALKLACNQPERFAAAASLSGALWTLPGFEAERLKPNRARYFETLYGDGSGIAGSHDDLFHQVERQLAAGTQLPRLYSCCGASDSLLEKNREIVAELRNRGVPITYEEGPGGHDWQFWDTTIQRTLNWMGFDIPAPDHDMVGR